VVPLSIFILCQTAESLKVFKGLDSVYYRYRAVAWDSIAAESAAGSGPAAIPDTGEGELKIRGVKDFSFDIKEGFNQGLQLDLRGKVESVAIEGNLSDQAVPGPTVRIADVERMSLKAQSKNFFGGIGNLGLELPFGVRDEIQGGRIGIHDPARANRAFLSYALNRGLFRRIEFSGEEGKQSPYIVTGKILPGSERVYGGQGLAPPVPLARDEDYTVDYDQSIISFTNRFIVTGRTRITVEYLDAGQDWSSVYQEADGAAGSSGLGLTVLYRRVYDDRNAPLAFVLSPVEIESLRTAGDSARVYHLYADTSSTGNYDQVAGHFVFAGAGRGHYNVTFFYAGESGGDYLYDPALKGFLYVGPGLGNYTPIKPVPPPQERQFYAADLRAGSGVDLTLYGSRLDRNEFSPRDDQDNGGQGWSISARQRVKFVAFDGHYIAYGPNLTLPAGRTAVDYNYQWDTRDTLRDLGEVAVGLDPRPDLTANFTYGVLNRQRQRWQADLKPLGFDLGYLRVDTLDKWYVGGSREINRFFIDARYENQEGNHYTIYTLRYPARDRWQLALSGDYERRERPGITTKIDLTSVPLDLTLGRRFYNDTTYLFGNLSARLNFRGLTLAASAQQSQVYSQKRDEYFDKVGAGNGDYAYDSVTGTYRSKEGGDYVKRIILLKEFERVVNRNYGLDAAFTRGMAGLRGRFSYLDQKFFLNHNENLSFSMTPGNYGLEINADQIYTRDERYALAANAVWEKSLVAQPALGKTYLLLRAQNRVETWADFVRERRDGYSGELGSEIGQQPYFQPRAGLGYQKIFSGYFDSLDLRLLIPKASLAVGFPYPGKGRIEGRGELVYRRYNTADVPYFFTVVDPPGLTKILSLTAGWAPADNTLLDLTYRVEFPPEGALVQNLKFNTRIRF
jgi:hypothetical protein